jgi:hypothetical protein
VARGRDYWEKFIKKELAIEDMLRYRYLISAEGNDVASGLKWMLVRTTAVVNTINDHDHDDGLVLKCCEIGRRSTAWCSCPSLLSAL